jgi:ubiquinone/menaquinone biosynthesis C-methylase UbiE
MPSPEIETLSECMVCGSRAVEALDADAALSRCKSCGYVFDNPRPTLNEIVRFYSKPTKYNSWLSEEEARTKLWTRRLRKMRRVARPGNLLDVGAGTGQFLHLARNDFTQVCGTEVSSSAVAIANEKYGLELLHGTLESLSLPSESFDNITAFHVLEHVPNPKAMIERCFSLLRSHGVLVVAVPNDFRPFKSRVRAAFGQLGLKRYRGVTRFGLRRIQLDGSMAEVHLSHFTPRVLRSLVEFCGFKVVRTSVDPYHVPVKGLAGLRREARYIRSVAFYAVTRVNLYDAVWMVARKGK